MFPLVIPIRYVVGAFAGLLALTLSGAGLPAGAAPPSPLGDGAPSPSATPACPPAWRPVAAPGDGTLFGSAVVSPTDVWAVGSSYNGSTLQPLTQHWDGQAWSVVLSSPVADSGRLNAVAVAPAGDLWAVGFTATMTQAHTLVEHWDGQSWSVVPSADTIHDSNQLNAVAVISENDVWAVGVLAEESETIIEHWDGTNWSLVPPPLPPAGRTYILNAVAGSAANDVWAAGITTDFLTSQTLLLHWNGTVWSVVPSPSPGTQHNSLSGMVVLTANDAWTVGYYWMAGSGNPYLALAEHWDGTAWTVVPTPNIGANVNGLNAVTAVNAHDLWAVGTYRNSFAPYWPLALHWDGSAWTVAAPPNPPAQNNGLYAVSAVGSSAVWAVGDQDTNGVQPLIELYSASCATPTVSVTVSPAPPTATATMPANPTLTPLPPTLTAPPATPTATATAPVNATLTPLPATPTTGPTVGVTPLTPSLTPTVTAASTAPATATRTPLPATLTVTPAAGSTVTPCPLHFSDVNDPLAYYYAAVYTLACRGVVSGYSDGTFRPYNETTRAQLAKIVVGGQGWAIDTSGGPHFRDVAVGSTFYSFVETAYHRGIISGYSDGTFRPADPVTRGQLSKIIVAAQGWALNTTGGPHFNDVATGNVFYPFVETALSHHIISGYSDGTFRPGNPATRGQIAKIVYLALTGGLQVKGR